MKEAGGRRPGPSGYLRNVIVLAGGTAAGRLLSVAVAPLLTRLYAPEDLGRVGAFVSFVSFGSVMGALRYEAAIISAEDDREAAWLVIISFALILPMSLMASAVLHILIRRSLLGFGILPTEAALWAFPTLAGSSAFLAARYWFVRKSLFAVVSRTLVLQQGARATVQVGLGCLRLGWIGLVLGELAGRAAGLGRMVVVAAPDVLSAARPASRAAVTRVLWRYRNFPIYSLPSSVLDSLVSTIVVPMLAAFYGAAPAGQFALVQMALAVPLAFVGASVSDAFFKRVSDARDAGADARSLVLRTMGSLMAVGILPAVMVIALGRTLFGVVFGPAWFQAGLMAEAVAPLALAQLVVGPVTPVVFVYNGQRAKLAYDASRLLSIGAIVAGHAAGWTPVQAVRAWSLVETGLYVVYVIILFRIIPRSARTTA
jgi:lipopolysaccharide exporter